MFKKTIVILFISGLLLLTGCRPPFEPVTSLRKPFLSINEEYDPLELISDSEDAGLIFEVLEDKIDITTPGDYSVTYVIYSPNRKQHVTREITVSVADELPPVLTVEDSITLKQGNLFNIADYATAIDDRDGDLKDKITYNGTLNTFKTGEYIITVSVSDRFNNSSSKEVAVIVTETEEVDYAKLISGKYTDVSYQSGQAPTLSLKSDGTFSLYINGCSLLSAIEGKYIIVEDTIYLNSPDNPFARESDDNLLLFTIQPNGTLLFKSEMEICAPNYDDIFVKDGTE